MQSPELTTLPGNDHDACLLEGLFQLAVSGHTDGNDFEQINSEVYARLLDAYASPMLTSRHSEAA